MKVKNDPATREQPAPPEDGNTLMKTKKTAVTTTWQSPSEVMDTLYDVREPGCDGVGFALLRPRAKQKANSVAALVSAKLSPIKPAANTPTTTCGMPVTARDHRVVLARGVADTSLTRLLSDYDAAVRPHQRLLAAVITVRGDEDMPAHDLLDMAATYATIHLARGRRLTSVVALHTPGNELSRALQHAHICILSRQHAPSGWLAEHEDLTDTAHSLWAEEWAGFRAGWDRLAVAA